MSIHIDKEKCIGCGKCIIVCPGSLIYQDNNGKAFIKYPKDCWGCTACLKQCSVQAIKYYLGLDMGGGGGYLTIKKEAEYLDWYITTKEGKTKKIRINSKEANKY
ncbi:4Fe-4S dicluster domain-containing protein [Defluviitalea phaphyphila]|uniref:4Fe-4S dicluster domain-containing protein n=1 Tax=Defluviitalea phaphyphila TaxID=1473580 RepID=UPI000730B1AF|nr:ferredoxin family protein [Defluviitalea phaphyphila]